jgi:hypothetical protein
MTFQNVSPLPGEKSGRDVRGSLRELLQALAALFACGSCARHCGIRALITGLRNQGSAPAPALRPARLPVRLALGGEEVET